MHLENKRAFAARTPPRIVEGTVVVPAASCSSAGATMAVNTITYPRARRGTVAEDHFGTIVPDPYR